MALKRIKKCLSNHFKLTSIVSDYLYETNISYLYVDDLDSKLSKYEKVYMYLSILLHIFTINILLAPYIIYSICQVCKGNIRPSKPASTSFVTIYAFLVAAGLSVHTAFYPVFNNNRFTISMFCWLAPLHVITCLGYLYKYVHKSKILPEMTFYSAAFIVSILSFSQTNKYKRTTLLVVCCAQAFLQIVLIAWHAIAKSFFTVEWNVPYNVMADKGKYEVFQIVETDRAYHIEPFQVITSTHSFYNENDRDLKIILFEDFCHINQFRKYFNDHHYDKSFVYRLVTACTSNRIQIKTVTKSIDRVTVVYEKLPYARVGQCFQQNETSYCKSIYMTTYAHLCPENHISGNAFPGSKKINKFFAVLVCGYHGFYKPIEQTYPAKNTMPALDPATYEDRLKALNSFIETRPKSNNTTRLKNYLIQCINWYHNRPFNRMAPTKEYKIRWENHMKWILGSPIVKHQPGFIAYEGKETDKVVITMQEIIEHKTVEEKKIVNKEITHVSKEVNAIVTPRSNHFPMNGNYAPEGEPLKNYKLSIVQKCECNKTFVQPPESYDGEHYSKKGIKRGKNLNYLMKMNFKETIKVEETHKRIVVNKTCKSFFDVNKYSVLSESSEDEIVETIEELPYKLSANSKKLDLSSKKKREMARLKNQTQVKEKLKKVGIQGKKDAKRYKEELSNKINEKVKLSHGDPVIKKTYIIKKEKPVDFEDWLVKSLKNKGVDCRYDKLLQGVNILAENIYNMYRGKKYFLKEVKSRKAYNFIRKSLRFESQKINNYL